MKRRILIYLMAFPLLFLITCQDEKGFAFSEIKASLIPNFDSGYNTFCNLDLSSNFELNAVQCSFYGDFQNALDQASKRQSGALGLDQGLIFDAVSKSEMINSLTEMIESSESDEASMGDAQKMLDIVNTPDVTELITESKKVSALEYIVGEAKNHHFTLINEAHWNSQHRSFTTSLLKPLWDQGYRYSSISS